MEVEDQHLHHLGLHLLGTAAMEHKTLDSQMQPQHRSIRISILKILNSVVYPQIWIKNFRKSSQALIRLMN